MARRPVPAFGWIYGEQHPLMPPVERATSRDQCEHGGQGEELWKLDLGFVVI